MLLTHCYQVSGGTSDVNQKFLDILQNPARSCGHRNSSKSLIRYESVVWWGPYKYRNNEWRVAELITIETPSIVSVKIFLITLNLYLMNFI